MNKLAHAAMALAVAAGLYMLQPSSSGALPQRNAEPSAVAGIAAAAQAAAMSAVPAASGFNETVENWIAELARSDGFAAWSTAQWSKFPLGPGTHGWVVLIHNESGDIGYMIVHARQDGTYMLGEYGLGNRPPYSFNTLLRTMAQHGLISDADPSDTLPLPAERIYIDPLHTLWKVSKGDFIYYFDAVTGELLPLDDTKVEATAARLTKSAATAPLSAVSLAEVEQQLDIASFDPFYRINWLLRKPMSLSGFQDLQLSLHHETEVTYTAQLYNNIVLSAFALTGYHRWNDNAVLLRLEHNGDRYIPYRVLEAQGHFFQ